MKRLLVTSLLFIFLLAACNLGTRGSGKIITEERSVSGFDQVSLTGSGDVSIAQGDSESLVIEAENNILPLLESKIVDGTLTIGPKANNVINPTKPVKYMITMRSINGLDASGSGKINAAEITTSVLDLGISGSGEINILTLNADTLNLKIAGSGNVEIGGQVTDQVINISGSGKYKGDNLDSRIADTKVSGSGSAVVRVEDALDVSISGSGGVSYYGDPIVKSDISGSGSVERLDE